MPSGVWLPASCNVLIWRAWLMATVHKPAPAHTSAEAMEARRDEKIRANVRLINPLHVQIVEVSMACGLGGNGGTHSKSETKSKTVPTMRQ